MADALTAPLLAPDELEALGRAGVKKKFRRGERLVSIGAESSEVFYLLDGLVKIVVVAESGTESIFGHRRAGAFVGEMSTLNNHRRSADVVAVEPTTTVMVTASRFTRYLEEFPSVAIALLRMQSRRLHEMTIRSMLGSRSVKARVASRLAELSDRAEADSGQARESGTVVKLTQADLAQLIDASREWTSKALGELQSEGAIRTARGRIIVIDSDQLRAASLD